MNQDCACSRVWRIEKANGTCGNCGGWLPGERPTLPWLDDALADDLRTINEAASRIDPGVDVLAEMYHTRKAEEA